MKDRKTIIVSNRLPVRVEIKDEEWNYHQSEGGLATGLGSMFKEGNNVWIGWPGASIPDQRIRQIITRDFRAQHLYPVMLSPEEIEHYYDGFSNDTLWPLFHYFPSYANYDPEDWEYYQAVNQKFADAVLDIAEPGDIIWIQDYQLMLVPEMVRRANPGVTVGFFQHIPFPSYEVFRLLPWRDALLKGLMGADLIGFHTFDDVRHFMSAAMRIANTQSNANEIVLDDRSVVVDAFPMGIDYEKYRDNVLNSKTKRNEHKLHQLMGDKKLMIAIDRLDYSKGIPQRLEAFELFLRDNPQFREQVIFLQLVVPSRDTVKQYATLKEEINRLVSEINAKYGSLSWQPIHYFYRSFPIEMLSALYASADIALVTPVRDGMNLVCKEYIASRLDKTGVLILSEMAGASKELYEALQINPTDKQAVAAAIREALLMPEAEQIRRMEALQQTVERFNIHHWVSNFMEKLNEVKHKQEQLSTRIITPQFEQHIKSQYDSATQRLIFLDYDGTLMPFHDDPLKVAPDEDLINLLKDLYEDEHNKVVVISGRKKETLEQWIGYLPIDIIAEHGAWFRKNGGSWELANDLSKDWKHEFYPLLKQFEMRTPGSFVEEKDYSLAWHYRRVDKAWGEVRAKEMINNLKYAAADLGLQLLEGNKVIEIKSANINKGNAAKEWLKQYPADFIVTIGDDQTDEDTFKAMPEGAFTIKVGAGISSATYYLKNPAEVRSFLRRLIDRDSRRHEDEGITTSLIKN
ncbi:bifunctional alpha,alpha-trehalose-phosphate synthase (UDP-forming)/trehalose-phosphatase [Taibaiella chishuiensis]|uniref:Alpha,alpha-trehalose-phosphate synthase n=1 Tax=Taibaiella chishuiensis TaxID=1434707 RepID=A0A2P8D1D2_9BACT|nr:bifunctional alpha,alpha-trehalose-phosphate synthase (UDP-forming)/trehalose-phosphatase [Taibaiella chishuiensis]PSK91015.1 trehalose 6-phosphate synthase/phosphatase [Taibaiella chishuiensis]